MAAFRDRNGIMYFAPGGPVRSPYDTINTGGGYGGGYGQPAPMVSGGGVPPGPPMHDGSGHIHGMPPPPGYSSGPAGSAAPGTQASVFGSVPYNPDGTPMTNAFVAQTPVSNMSFNPGQFNPALQQSSGNLGQLQSMLMNQANGGGPNPAAEQLKQSTSRNIAQAYALAQSSPNNAGAARNIAEQVGQINQQSASDAAQQRMQQQLNAQGLLSQTGLGVYGTSGRLMTDAQKMQLEQAQGNQQAALASQGINAATSTGNQQYGSQFWGGVINAGAGVAGHLVNGMGGSGGGSSTPPSNDSGVVGSGDETFAAYGGMIPARHYDMGGYVAPNASPADFTDYSGKSQVPDPRSGGGMYSSAGGIGAYGRPRPSGGGFGDQVGSYLNYVPVFGPLMAADYKLGHYSTMFDSDGSGIRTAKQRGLKESTDGGGVGGYNPVGWLSGGGAVPGHASVPGNSYDNDKIPAMLSAKEIVLPRSVTMAPDAPERSKEFVEAILRSKRKKSS